MRSLMLLADWYRPTYITNAHGHERVGGYVLHKEAIAVHVSGVEELSTPATSTLLDADKERITERVVVLVPSRYGIPQRGDELRNIRGRDGTVYYDKVKLIDVSFSPGPTMYYVGRGVVVDAAS